MPEAVFSWDPASLVGSTGGMGACLQAEVQDTYCLFYWIGGWSGWVGSEMAQGILPASGSWVIHERRCVVAVGALMTSRKAGRQVKGSDEWNVASELVQKCRWVRAGLSFAASPLHTNKDGSEMHQILWRQTVWRSLPHDSRHSGENRRISLGLEYWVDCLTTRNRCASSDRCSQRAEKLHHTWRSRSARAGSTASWQWLHSILTVAPYAFERWCNCFNWEETGDLPVSSRQKVTEHFPVFNMFPLTTLRALIIFNAVLKGSCVK